MKLIDSTHTHSRHTDTHTHTLTAHRHTHTHKYLYCLKIKYIWLQIMIYGAHVAKYKMQVVKLILHKMTYTRILLVCVYMYIYIHIFLQPLLALATLHPVAALQKFNKRCSIVRMPIILQLATRPNMPPPPSMKHHAPCPPTPNSPTHPAYLSISLTLVVRRQFEKHCQCIFCRVCTCVCV